MLDLVGMGDDEDAQYAIKEVMQGGDSGGMPTINVKPPPEEDDAEIIPDEDDWYLHSMVSK